jgi:hypothetical protein
VINTSCGIAQLPADGDTEITTGALVPKFKLQIAVRVNAPNTLLSPVPNDVSTVIAAGPPQHTAGNADDEFVPNDDDTPNVDRTRLHVTVGVDIASAVESGTPSPFVSHINDAVTASSFPGRTIGMPVSLWKPWQIVVWPSCGNQPQPTRLNCTAHSALITPVVVGVVCTVPTACPGVCGITVWHCGAGGGAQPMP